MTWSSIGLSEILRINKKFASVHSSCRTENAKIMYKRDLRVSEKKLKSEFTNRVVVTADHEGEVKQLIF